LGCEDGEHIGWEREWLYWYDCDGVRYATDAEMAVQEREKSWLNVSKGKNWKPICDRKASIPIKFSISKLIAIAILEQILDKDWFG